MNSEGGEPRDNKSSTGTAAKKSPLDFRYEDVSPLEGEELEELRASLVPLKLESVDTVPLATEPPLDDQHLDRSGEGAAPGASEATAALTSEESAEPPRAPILTILTVTPGPVQTSFVTHMDVSQGHSTAAPSPELESGEDFPAARSDVVTTGVYTDQLDLSSLCFSFTTSDPTVLRTRMLLLTVPDEDPSQLDVLEHGKWVLKRVQQLVRQLSHQCIYDAQQYLDRLKETDFADYSADQRRQVADTVKRLAKVDGFTLQCREASSKDCKTVTNVRSNLSNDRSKGTFRVSSGSHVVTTDTPRGHFPQLCAVPQEEENEATHADTNSEI